MELKHRLRNNARRDASGALLRARRAETQRLAREKAKCLPSEETEYVPVLTSFNFLDLPFEVRLQIYEWVVLQQQKSGRVKSYEETSQTKSIPSYGYGPYSEISITLVSKAIREESLSTFYKLRRFPLHAVAVPTPKVRNIRGVAPYRHA